MTYKTRSSPLYQYPYKRSPRNRGEIKGQKNNRINNGKMSPQFDRKQIYRSKNIQKQKSPQNNKNENNDV